MGMAGSGALGRVHKPKHSERGVSPPKPRGSCHRPRGGSFSCDAFDASPAWEDITAQVAINRVYNFLNQSKTAEKWGVNVRFTIEKNEGYEGEVSISGFGGAYE